MGKGQILFIKKHNGNRNKKEHELQMGFPTLLVAWVYRRIFWGVYGQCYYKYICKDGYRNSMNPKKDVSDLYVKR